MNKGTKGTVYVQNDGTIYKLHHVDKYGVIYYSDAIIKGNSNEVDFDVVDCGIGIFGRNGDREASREEIENFIRVVSAHKPN